ncbi:hypothetical protein [Candidatus Nitronereus thalassa]|uniref:Uncharacterized protein n=1 Tax=Candidatus Nitronereus thalassa TaxID=3020898 RepID=A0ABU3K8U9_9BACT|nr:hypothetical protein [Candidatus Nitronereus thalassa]MDT7042718.1 hypothetical protein [Candidatus Nitronereus thalassa]
MTRESSLNIFTTSLHEEFSQFRHQVKQAKSEDPVGWELTRKLVEPRVLPTTLDRLTEHLSQNAYPSSIQERLIAALQSLKTPTPKTKASTDTFRELTGLPPTKAIRALCVLFGFVVQKLSIVDSAKLEAFVRAHPNPYDWLLETDQPSLLDLGAGDLSFEEELTEQYLPQLHNSKKSLTLHALDRLQPGSQLGGVYHANPERLTRLAKISPEHLNFRFWGAKDMLDLSTSRERLTTYSVVTCHAPATPTFAYEPTRVSQHTIEQHLQQTKGEFKTVRIDGEEALEVKHRGRTLTFPSWKFAIRGPLALLDVLFRQGQLCILSAIDAEVFWEILAQLVDNEAMRPSNIIFTEENLPTIFKQVYESLSSLNEGERCDLSNLIPLRVRLPQVLTPRMPGASGFRFRYVEVRRGAVFSDMPASFTAKQFSQMSEEAPPWCLILIPDR